MSSAQNRAVEEAQRALVERFVPAGSVSDFEWSGGHTQVLVAGDGPPLLLVHGGLGNPWEWFNIVPALAETRRVFAVHRPGHGLADPFDYQGVDLRRHAVTFLSDIADSLDLDTVDIVANSIGGMWGVMFALDAPDRVGRLVLAGMPMGVKRSVPFEVRLLGMPVIGRPIGKLVMGNPKVESNRKFWGKVLVADPGAVDELLLVADIASQQRNLDSMLSLVGCIASAGGVRADLMFGKEWNTLQTPTLILIGDHDAFGTTQDAETVTLVNDSIQVEAIPDAGHLPWIDQPDQVVQEIRRFIDT